MRLIVVPLARLGAKTWSPGLAIPESRVAHFKSERYPGIASWGISAVPFDELRAGSTGLFPHTLIADLFSVSAVQIGR